MAKRAADSDLAPTPKKARPDGKGTHTDADGTVADGVFADGQLVKGTKTHKNGLVEDGAFVDGKLVKGNKTYKDGAKEKGTFADGKLVKGKKTYKIAKQSNFDKKKSYYTNIIEQGMFDNGDFIQGTKTSGSCHEEGRFKDGKIVEGSRDDEETGTFEDGVLRKGAECCIGIEKFGEFCHDDHVLYKGIWDKDEKFVKGVKFYFEPKAQAYENGKETDEYFVDHDDFEKDVDAILAGLQ